MTRAAPGVTRAVLYFIFRYTHEQQCSFELTFKKAQKKVKRKTMNFSIIASSVLLTSDVGIKLNILGHVLLYLLPKIIDAPHFEDVHPAFYTS